MNSPKIEELLSRIGCDKIKYHNFVIKSSCPFATKDHSKGIDKNPSFWVTINSTGPSKYGCFACKRKGTLINLIRAMESEYSLDLSDHIAFIRENDVPVRVSADIASRSREPWNSTGTPIPNNKATPIKGGRDYSDPEEYTRAISALPDDHNKYVDYMKNELNEYAIEYLINERCISHSSIQRWSIGWHPWSWRISIPQYDSHGRLVNISGRLIDPGFFCDECFSQPKWKHAYDFKKTLYLFGEDKIDKRLDICFLVEGQFDAIYLDDKGMPNVLAILGSDISDIQSKKISKWFDRAILIMDGDRAGIEAAEKIKRRLSNLKAVDSIDLDSGADPDHLSMGDVYDIKNRFI